MKTQTESRKLKDLKATNPYLRLQTDVTDLEKSIKTVGLIAPLVISTDNVILAGARRYQALLNLGYSEAPVVIIDQGDLEKELISIDENLVRKDLNKVELEGHLRRAKEIYQSLNPIDEVETKSEEDTVEKITLPAEKFLHIVAEKTGLSPKQIHEAINRDEMASPEVKIARQKGELSISQTNEIVKLSPDEQKKSLRHIQSMPVKEIKKFIKEVKAKGVEAAIEESPKHPHARDFAEIEQTLKKLHKKLKQLELEGITAGLYPENIKAAFDQLLTLASEKSDYDLEMQNDEEHFHFQ